MMKRTRQVTLNGGPPSPKKEVAVPINETPAERKQRHAIAQYRHEREVAAWKRSK